MSGKNRNEEKIAENNSFYKRSLMPFKASSSLATQCTHATLNPKN
jgi:hypothetical protein